MSKFRPAAPSLRGWEALRRAPAVMALLFAMAGWYAPAHAADAPAGRSITNVASLRYDVDGAQQTVASNPATLSVAERLDLTLDRADTGAVTVSAGAVAVPFVLTNTGNGDEAFQLDATLAAGDSQIRLVAIDVDGDGRFDPAQDRPLTDGRTPALAATGALRLLVVIDTPATVAPGSLTVTARAVTISGQLGTTAAGRGDDGSDAVVGPTGAAASVVVPLILGTTAPAPTLVKSQTVVAPDGSSNAVRGAVITYTLVAQFAGEAGGVAVTDPIPTGTAYVPGSLTLDGASLSDASDTDPGQVSATDGVSVALGTVAAPATHTIRFNVTIQ